MSSSLEKSRTAEAEVTESEWIGADAADNHVVEEFNIDGLRRLPELPGLCEAPDYGKWRLALFADTA